MEISNAKSQTTAMQLPGCGEPPFSNSNQTNDFLKTGDSLKHRTVSFKKSYYFFILITLQAYSFRCLQIPEQETRCSSLDSSGYTLQLT